MPKLIKNYFFIFFILLLTKVLQVNSKIEKDFTLMLDPAGDASNSGRIIEDSSERGLTLQFAQNLKKELEDLFVIQNNLQKNLEKNLKDSLNKRIILTRIPGETIEPLQNASFSNRLQADLYVNINIYQIKETNIPNTAEPNIGIYYYLRHPITDFWNKPLDKLEFFDFDQAYKLALADSAKAAKLAFENLKNLKELSSNSIICVGLPFKPLAGVLAPSFGVEIGVKSKLDFKRYVKPIASALSEVINKLKN